MDRSEFCTAFGIDPAAATAALERARPAGHLDQPWYVQAMLGLGSWITALVVIAFCCFFLALVFDLDDEPFGAALAVVGTGFFAVGFIMLLRRTTGVFAAHFATAIAAAGQAMAAVGAGMLLDEVWPAALASLPFAALVSWVLESRTLQALSTAWAVILVFVALNDQNFAFMLEFAALLVAAGVALHLYPPRRDLVPMASVLLLVGPVLSIMFDLRDGLGVATGEVTDDLLAKAIFIVLTLFLLHAIWRHLDDRTAQIELALFAAAAIAVSAVMPVGAAAALVILVLAFVLGAHALALIGILLEVYFLWKFYYDLDMTLLEKSLMLMGVGVVVLALWGAMARLAAKTVEQGS